MSDYWHWLIGIGSHLKNASTHVLWYLMGTMSEEASGHAFDIDQVASQVTDKYSLTLDIRSAIAGHLQSLPPCLSVLLHSLYCEPSSYPPPGHGNELLTFLEELAPRIHVEAFIQLLAQAAFQHITHATSFSDSVSFRGLKDQIAATLEEKTTVACSPLSGQLNFSGDPKRQVLRLEPPTLLDVRKFGRINSLDDLPGKRIAFIGCGGGSDGVQASILGLLCKNAGKDLQFVASVRAAKTTSEDPKGTIGISRTISNHKGEVSPGVFKVSHTSTGSGRFVENVPAADVDMYLVTEAAGPNGLSEQIAQLIDLKSKEDGAKGPIDTLVLVDTGGDVLQDPKEATAPEKQHQDLRVLHELAARSSVLRTTRPKLNVLSAIVAPGIDHPDNSQTKLEAARADFFVPSQAERDVIQSTYERWDFTGSPSGLKAGKYGKTPFAWQTALRAWEKVEAAGAQDDLGKLALDQMQFHTTVVKLPVDRVMDKKNPWNPFVPMQLAMAGILFMRSEDVLRAVAPELA